MENKFGKTSTVQISVCAKDHQTIMKDLTFTAPFKIAHPFYKKDGTMQLMLMSASAGIMAGDIQEISISAHSGSRLEVTSQAFEKIHKMKTGGAKRKTSIWVGEEASCLYNPLPAIPFAGSAFDSETEICLVGTKSRFIMQEILTCGRKAMGEQFSYRFYRSLVSVKRDQKLIYRDHCCFIPAQMDMIGFGFYEGYTHLSNLVLFGQSESRQTLEQIRELLLQTEEVTGGVSLLGSGDIAIRILGQNAQILQELGSRILLLCQPL